MRGRAIHSLAIAASLVSIACSKKEPPPLPSSTADPPTTTPVVHAGWGSGTGQLGRDVPEQGLPEGPKSFAVDANGTVFVLDQINSRVVRFENDAAVGTAVLPPRPFSDLELDGDGLALLELHEQPGIVFVTADGSVVAEVPIVDAEVPEPSLVTALVRGSDGWYVEVEDSYLVRVADTTHAEVEQGVVPGQLLAESSVLKLEAVAPNRFSLIRQPLPDGEPAELASPSFAAPLAERTLFAEAAQGKTWLAARLTGEQPDPEQAPALSHQLVTFDSGGIELGRANLPLPGGLEDTFRAVKRGDDGHLYVMALAESGVVITKVTP